jgi:hypothetical protein
MAEPNLPPSTTPPPKKNNHPEDGNTNVCRNVGKPSTFNAACSRKPKETQTHRLSQSNTGRTQRIHVKAFHRYGNEKGSWLDSLNKPKEHLLHL